MNSATVIRFDAARERGRRVRRAVDARRKLHEGGERRSHGRSTGRAWLNGAELGGTPEAYTHLGESYD